jgi:ATP-dependent Clp protease ATP-binding subunit ClpB
VRASRLCSISYSSIPAADEYRKTIAKDAALERRFQPVSIGEPSVPATLAILRGLRARYELHHGVPIADGALVAAATFAHRYIADRFLPDKALDVLDEAAAALRLAHESRPERLEALGRDCITLEIERESLRREEDALSVERLREVEAELSAKRAEAEKLEVSWKAGTH